MNTRRSSPILSSALAGAGVLGALLLAATVVSAAEPAPAAPAAPAAEAALSSADLGALRSFVELARSDIRTEKALVIAQNIEFTAEEASEFWPLEREYNLEFNKILDRRLELIKLFVETDGKMGNEKAAELAEATFKLEEQRTQLKRKYFPLFSSVIPAAKAARFFQIENQVNMAIDLNIAAALPLIK